MVAIDSGLAARSAADDGEKLGETRGAARRGGGAQYLFLRISSLTGGF